MNSELRAFYRNFPIAKFDKGEIIIHQDETPKCVYAVRSGVVEIYNVTLNGECRTIGFNIVDDIFPTSWAFSKTTKAMFFYKAYSNCEVYTINKQAFLLHLSDNHKFMQAILERKVKELISTQLQIDALEKPHSNLKLLYLFRYLCLRHGRDIVEDMVKIQIPLTQQEIANFVGLTRETVAIEISKLRSDKIISTEHKYYIVNTAKLNQRLDEEYNSVGIEVSTLL